MPTVVSSATIPASAEAVFDFLADYRNIPRLQPHFASARLATDIERGMGAEVDLEGRFHGMPMKVRNKIIAFEPPHRLVSISDGTVLSRSTWELEPLPTDPSTTRVSLTLDYKLGGSIGGLLKGLGSALSSIFDREVQTMTDDSLRRLRAFLSKPPSSPGSE